MVGEDCLEDFWGVGGAEGGIGYGVEAYFSGICLLEWIVKRGGERYANVAILTGSVECQGWNGSFLIGMELTGDMCRYLEEKRLGVVNSLWLVSWG